MIYKYELKIVNEQLIEMPYGSEILCVQMQNDKPWIWAIFDMEKVAGEISYNYKTICIIGTGALMENKGLKYIGTFQDKNFVGHVFEKEDWL